MRSLQTQRNRTSGLKPGAQQPKPKLKLDNKPPIKRTNTSNHSTKLFFTHNTSSHNYMNHLQHLSHCTWWTQRSLGLAETFRLKQFAIPTHEGISSMANLQQAMSAMKNERAPKAARTTKGKDGKGQARPQSATNSQASTAGTTDTTLIHGLARLTLQQQPQLRAAFDANSITFLIQPEETKNELNELVTTWFNDLQDNKDKTNYQPFGCTKQVLVFQFMIQILQKAQPDQANPNAPPWSILKQWLGIPADEIRPFLTEFRAKYRTPKENRKWVWQLTVSATAPDSFRQELRTLLNHNDSWKDTGVEVVATRSSVPALEKELWKQLKNKS